ncbi:hypothetical protein [Plantactinospora sp. KBS50]|uniref:hypothetical protein n=1 Tax=Plantactinospora sp. KBS50 TaxID=2024580 RepID=UPI000BAAF162|nr:hypothetical protein [Plantactinospora sp. KBS50]ASW57063.1 hypothetical protein CIK06_27315 [Plantactinospora sp. KBS50]
MIETLPLAPAVVRPLRTFADGDFEMSTMSGVAATLGAPSPASDERLACFDLPGDLVLQLAAADDRGERVGAAVVPLCGWDPGTGGELSGHAERSEYDAHYDAALDIIRSAVGAPDHDGIDNGSFPLRWAVWLGRTGLMALQQSHYDDCPDINVWVRPRPADGFAPTQPFAEWLITAP